MRDKAGVRDARIVIVDDKGANVLLLEQVLQALGYRQLMSTQDPFAVCELHRALMFLDLDQFKQLNDTQGHDVGDLLLQQLSTRLLLCVREGDCVARFGGDEFVVLLDALGQLERDATLQADSVAQKILQQMRQSFDLLGQRFDSSLSIGAVIFLGAAEPAADLLKKADLAMYRAKTMGRGQVCFFDAIKHTEFKPNRPLALIP